MKFKTRLFTLLATGLMQNFAYSNTPHYFHIPASDSVNHEQADSLSVLKMLNFSKMDSKIRRDILVPQMEILETQVEAKIVVESKNTLDQINEFEIEVIASNGLETTLKTNIHSIFKIGNLEGVIAILELKELETQQRSGVFKANAKQISEVYKNFVEAKLDSDSLGYLNQKFKTILSRPANAIGTFIGEADENRAQLLSKLSGAVIRLVAGSFFSAQGSIENMIKLSGLDKVAYLEGKQRYSPHSRRR